MIYKDPKAPVEERVADLLARMTLEEKIAQVQCMEIDSLLLDDKVDMNKVAENLDEGIGQLRDYFHVNEVASVQAHNQVQKYLMEETRLGIPAIIHGEGLHGYVNDKATSFPQASAMASTFNLELIDSVYSTIAREARSRGVAHLLSPVLDVVRDPKWGRFSESFGEDPYLAGEIAVQVVNSMQGENQDIASNDHVIATLKHFPGHGTTVAGLNCAPIVATERELKEVYMYPFEQAVKRAGALAVMASYGEYDGIPTHTNPNLLKDVLRDQWGFNGIVVSDYFAIPLLTTGW
ncbi:MAG: glycoside hydrolase family 3 protein, partial [bacterium]